MKDLIIRNIKEVTFFLIACCCLLFVISGCQEFVLKLNEIENHKIKLEINKIKAEKPCWQQKGGCKK